MTKGKSLEDFKNAHDRPFLVRQRVEAALASLGDSWEYHSEFMKRARIAHNEWGALASVLQDYMVDTPGRGANHSSRRVIAGTKAFAAKLRAQLRKPGA